MFYIVTGANYGDEGKGLVTNAFADEDCLVVLSNGSSQRAHTVVYNGQRVVFRHFGSGTLKGAANYFARDFLVNPAMFRQEYIKLKAMGIIPKVYMNADCPIVTPVDMFANVNIESRRENRHGTTGCGVWESIRRQGYLGRMTVNNAIEQFESADFFQYYHGRLGGIEDKVPDEVEDFLSGAALSYNFKQDIEFLLDHVQLIDETSDGYTEFKLLHKYEKIIFENGQGLLLDTDYVGESIYTTPCHVGARIPARIIADNFMGENPKVESIYVTRTYLTRHGAGDFANGSAGTAVYSSLSPYMTEDKTNVPNFGQGTIRYEPFDNAAGHDLVRRIKKDTSILQKYGLDASTSLAVTHTNEYALENLTDKMIFSNGGPSYSFRLYTSDNESTLNMEGES